MPALRPTGMTGRGEREPDDAVTTTVDPGESGLDADVDATPGTGAEGGSGRLRNPISGRGFLAALALAVGGVTLGGAIPLVGWLGGFLGVFLAAFLVGLASARRRYAEVGLAGALAAGASFLLGAPGTLLFPVVADYGVEIAVLGAGTGLVVALLGHYFGRDLRDGVTRDL